MFTTITILVLMAWIGVMYFKDRLRVSSESLRLARSGKEEVAKTNSKYRHLLTRIGAKTKDKKDNLTLKEQAFLRKLQDAGLENSADIGFYYLLKIICCVGGPILGALGYLGPSTYYGTVFFVICTVIFLCIPPVWLKQRTARRTEEIQRELPLLIDLTNLGTSAGWDVASSLERVVDALVQEYPEHPLMREFAKGRLLTQTGYTWHETLERISEKLGNDAVRRCALALGQAIRQGGDRTSQLEGIAQDAQRIFYAALDQRLAGLPVKAVLITMVLMLSYFMIILAPAAIQIKNAMVH